MDHSIQTSNSWRNKVIMKIAYDAKVCIHAGNCVNNLPAVFKIVNEQLVIDPKGASEAEIRQTVASCPSGALQIADTDMS
ncbi:(4Fe-4S)-binding protein [Nitrosomonas aestuarii]|uniref:(4Fe-4S)-binding protein n=1 Tax=Nitrosomonas aestuarii TaxID=52441 RepID=UPI000D408742|nr:(4Fe-4S)-binding protein [Nitrosomonas aestuarii]PTN11431.1 putative Fe-S cluster protein YjdI [Nitrosomonas aestuarii]